MMRHGWLCIALLVSGVSVWGTSPSSSRITIGNSQTTIAAPYFYGTYDAAGFSDDGIYYGPSPEHPVTQYHELLSGEWGAAVYYDGINTRYIDVADPTKGRQAMWLTDLFVYPNWPTNSTFSVSSNPNKAPLAWADPNNNPAPLNDTAISYIQNEKIEVRIDYEVVDLNFRDPNYNLCRSPMTFLDDDHKCSGVAYSDRFIILQTYTLKNITSESLTHVAFYQFLHGHGADAYGPTVNSTYTDVEMEDPLADYVPYNPIHQVGNFKYDITQWNTYPHPQNRNATHKDYTGFSSTRRPDWFDTDVYEGGHSYREYKPPVGTHIHIENRDLNGKNRIYNAEAGGAMGWNLGTLAAGESESITVAFMFGHGQPDYFDQFSLTKTAEPNLPYVDVGQELTYTLTYVNDSNDVSLDAVLVDYLPAGADFIPGSFDGYNPLKHTYTWTIPPLLPGESGSVSLNVRVNERSEPGGVLRNEAVLYGTGGLTMATLDTPVAGRDGVIYVNRFAEGSDSGTSWDDAYPDLQQAIARAKNSCGREIWVADGTYFPGMKTTDSFTIPDSNSLADGIKLYGGFAGNETSIDQRNISAHPTILSGFIDEDTYGNIRRNTAVVTMGNHSLLDGFTVVESGGYSASYGIFGQNRTFTISNCVVKDNLKYGMYLNNSNATIKWCTVENNVYDGIRHLGNKSKTITIQNCRIEGNAQNGIFSEYSIPTVRNSLIGFNGSDNSSTYYGLYLFCPQAGKDVRNNTVVYNVHEGIRLVDPNAPLTVNNCILYGNQDNTGRQFGGNIVARYSLVYDPNNPNQTTPDTTYHNISCNPQFAYADDPNNVHYHLLPTSPCIDKGNPALSYTDQVDLDRETRRMGTAVEMGADEVDPECDAIANSYDKVNADGLVNLEEFNLFSRAWLAYDPYVLNPNCPDHAYYTSDPNSPQYVNAADCIRWDSRCNIIATGASQYVIDLADLMAFVNQAPWLWRACWRTDIIAQQAAAAMASSTNSISERSLQSESLSEESLAASAMMCVETTSALSEESACQTEQDSVLALLSAINGLLETEESDREALLEIKNILEQSLAESEDTAIETVGF